MTFVDLLEEFTSSSFPLLLPRTSTCWTLQRADQDPAEFTGRLKISLGADTIGEFPLPIKFGETLLHRSTATIAGLPIEHPGVLTFEFSAPDVETVTFSVEIKGAPNFEISGPGQIAMAM